MSNNLWVQGLAVVGGLTVVRSAYTVLDFLSFHLFRPSRPLSRYKRTGPERAYALITGASAGIGLGVAQALAKQGFGVILLGHLPDELASAADGLRQMVPGAAVQTIVLDARTASPDEMQAALRSISKLRLSILVNNVGGNPIALPAFRPLASYTAADVDAVINQNARFMARLTALAIPQLARGSSASERSLILNTSSAGMVGMPYLTMYSATKAFNYAFSHALARELELEPETAHVDCITIVPGDVHSQGNSEGVPAVNPNWDVFGQSIVSAVDGALRRGRRAMSPFWLHEIQLRVIQAVPEALATFGVKDLMVKKKNAFNSLWEKSR